MPKEINEEQRKVMNEGWLEEWRELIFQQGWVSTEQLEEIAAHSRRRALMECREVVKTMLRVPIYSKDGECEICGLNFRADCVCYTWNEAIGSVVRRLDGMIEGK